MPRPTGLNRESDLEGGGSADGSAQLHHSAGQADADRLARQAAVMAEATSVTTLFITNKPFDIRYAFEDEQGSSTG